MCVCSSWLEKPAKCIVCSKDLNTTFDLAHICPTGSTDHPLSYAQNVRRSIPSQCSHGGLLYQVCGGSPTPGPDHQDGVEGLFFSLFLSVEDTFRQGTLFWRQIILRMVLLTVLYKVAYYPTPNHKTMGYVRGSIAFWCHLWNKVYGPIN